MPEEVSQQNAPKSSLDNVVRKRQQTLATAFMWQAAKKTKCDGLG
jgi:hypothetical protein